MYIDPSQPKPKLFILFYLFTIKMDFIVSNLKIINMLHFSITKTNINFRIGTLPIKYLIDYSLHLVT